MLFQNRGEAQRDGAGESEVKKKRSIETEGERRKRIHKTQIRLP